MNRKSLAGIALVGMAFSLSQAKASSRVNVSFYERTAREVVIRLKDASAGQRNQAQVIATLQEALGEPAVVDLRPFRTDKRFHVVRLAEDEDLESALEALERMPGVEYAEPNYRFHMLDEVTPNDPDISKTWGLKNVGQPDAAGQVGTAGADIQVFPLWQRGMVGSRNVVVAVIDTGVDLTHPDLIENIYSNPGESGEKSNNGIDDDGNGFVDDFRGWNFIKSANDPTDDQGHGTHVSGTIGATGNNGIGVAGVNWQVSLLPIKFLDASGGGTLEGAVESINYARLMKVNVMSNSWGGPTFSAALEEAVKAAQKAGILFIAAAGNDGGNNDVVDNYPADFKVDNVVSVAATDNQDKLASFSNFGIKSVHVAAPGVKTYSTYKGGQYKTLSGTSMATPHVAGVAALLLAAHPEWTYSELKDRLIRSCDKLPGMGRKIMSGGRVNATNALDGIYPPSTEPDETLWKSIPYALETEHPYQPKVNVTFTIQHPGAKYIRVHFEKLETERFADRVTVESPSGEVFSNFSGVLSDITSDYIIGDTAIVRLKTDMSVNRWGFKIDAIQVIE